MDASLRSALSLLVSRWRLGLGAGVASSCLCAGAQPVPAAPPQVSPGVLQEQLRRLAPEPSSGDGLPLAEPVPRVSYPVGAASAKVTVRRVELSGNTVIPTADLASAWDGLEGREVPVTTLYDLAFALSGIYRNRGYVLSGIEVTGAPEKNGLPDGVLRLRTVEGYVAKVEFDSDQPVSERIRRQAEVMAVERPLTIATFERQMLIINDIPGVQAQAYLSRVGPPGEALLTLKVARQKLSGLVGMQNRVSDLLGNVLIEGRVSLNNAFGWDEGQSLLLQTTDKARLRSVGYAYDQPIGTSGLTFNGFLAHIESKSSISEADIFRQNGFLSEQIRSKSDVASFGLSYPVLRSRTQTLRLRARVGIYNGSQEGQVLQVRQDERVRAVRLGAAWDRRDVGGINFADAEWSHGLSGAGATSGASTAVIRQGADYGFDKLNFTLGRLQQLGGAFSLLASVQGQWTNDRLPSSERYALGGDVILRAFDAGDLIGDRAAAGKLELRYEPGLLPGGQLVFYAFAEHGRVRSIEQRPTTDVVAKGGTTGLGVRGTLPNRINFYAEAASPHGRNPSSTNSRRTRFFAGLSYQFN